MIEHDLLGNIAVPEGKYYGAQTQRSLQLSPSSRETLEQYPELIYSIAAIKKAYAQAHETLGVLEPEMAQSIIAAAEDVMEGRLAGSFPADVICGGGCVNIHMNVNEVIAKRANERMNGERSTACVHPNSHVNKGQSTNDVIPAAIKLALYHNLEAVYGAVACLRDAYEAKAAQYRDTVKVSRTCLQDAVPITFGQFYGASVSFLNRQLEKLQHVMADCLQLPLGATAVGTGLNLLAGSRELVFENLSQIVGKTVCQEKNVFDGLQYADSYLEVSAELKATITGISKMARDIRIMSSGPRSGLGEIRICPVQNGSSIMPGKINPALPESMNILAYLAAGVDSAVTMAAEGGELELNVWEAVMISELLRLTQILPPMVQTFAEKCVSTIQVCEEHCRQEACATLSSAAMISAVKGYEAGTAVAQYADRNHLSLKEAAIQCGCLEAEEAEQLLDPLMLTNQEETGRMLLKLETEKRQEA